MKIEIEYCDQWGYEPRAPAARELIVELRPSAQVNLRRSTGGCLRNQGRWPGRLLEEGGRSLSNKRRDPWPSQM